MKKFNYSFSDLFGYFVVILVSIILTELLSLFLNFNRLVALIIYLVIYFLILKLIDVIRGFAINLIIDKFYKASFLCILLVFWFNLAFSYKFIRILIFLMRKNDSESIQKYFYDNDSSIQYLSLLLCAESGNVAPVVKWFEDNYIRKNLPIDSYFYPIYTYISTPFQNEQENDDV